MDNIKERMERMVRMATVNIHRRVIDTVDKFVYRTSPVTEQTDEEKKIDAVNRVRLKEWKESREKAKALEIPTEPKTNLPPTLKPEEIRL